MEITKVEYAASLLFGSRWKSSLARAVGVHQRTVRKWIDSGEVPDHVRGSLLALLKSRRTALGAAVRDLDRRKRR